MEERIGLLEQRVSSVENELKHIDKSLSAGGIRMQNIEAKLDNQTVLLTRIETKLEQNAANDEKRDKAAQDAQDEEKWKRIVDYLVKALIAAGLVGAGAAMSGVHP